MKLVMGSNSKRASDLEKAEQSLRDFDNLPKGTTYPLIIEMVNITKVIQKIEDVFRYTKTNVILSYADKLGVTWE